MASDYSAGNIARVKLSSWMDGQLGLMVLNFKCIVATGPGITDVDLAPVLAGNLAGPLKALLSGNAEYLGLSVRNMAAVPAIQSTVSVTGAGAGSAGTAPLPPQTAAILSWKTGLIGRRNKGRNYVPFPDEADNPASHIPGPGYITRANTLIAAILATQTVTVTGTTVSLVLCITDKVGLLGTNVTRGQLQPGWGTQKRRGDFGRFNFQSVAI
jgi:hypothetical protein